MWTKVKASSFDYRDRAAYIVMELQTGRTQQSLADELKLSPQRVSQINMNELALLGATKDHQPWLVAIKSRRRREAMEPHSVEYFYWFERKLTRDEACDR